MTPEFDPYFDTNAARSIHLVRRAVRKTGFAFTREGLFIIVADGILVAVVFARAALVLENETNTSRESWIRRDVLRIRWALTSIRVDRIDTASCLIAIVQLRLGTLVHD